MRIAAVATALSLCSCAALAPAPSAPTQRHEGQLTARYKADVGEKLAQGPAKLVQVQYGPPRNAGNAKLWVSKNPSCPAPDGMPMATVTPFEGWYGEQALGP